MKPDLLLNRTRVAILCHLADETELSPSVLAERTGNSLGTTAYHVRVLHEAGAIRLVREARVRGAVEHFYRLDARRRGRLATLAQQTAELATTAHIALRE